MWFLMKRQNKTEKVLNVKREDKRPFYIKPISHFTFYNQEPIFLKLN